MQSNHVHTKGDITDTFWWLTSKAITLILRITSTLCERLFFTDKNAQCNTLGWVRCSGRLTPPLTAESPVTLSSGSSSHQTCDQTLALPLPTLSEFLSLAVSILWWQAAIWWKSCDEYRCSARILCLSPALPFVWLCLSPSVFPFRLIYLYVVCWRGACGPMMLSKQEAQEKANSLYNSFKLSLYLGHLSVGVVIREKQMWND